MSKKIKGSYLLNAVSVALVFALLTGLFAANAFGKIGRASCRERV